MHLPLRAAYRWFAAPLLVLLLAGGNSLPVAAATVQPSFAHGQLVDWQRAGPTPLEQAPVPKPKPGSGSGSGEGSIDEAPTDHLVEEGAPDPALAVTNLDDVEKAVVQIEAVGTFADPSEGMIMNAAGRGSGFIIDPAGIAVTNNHVVTGAAFLKVFVAGEAKPRNARVLGVSECSDLAVIDIQGDGYPYLTWSKERVKVGLEIYAAGFPLGDPEFTLTRGIIAKANADGESSWASVDHVIQHDAATNPGNSGGPIVDENGGAIAVHYAGNNETDQYFAIAIDEALPVLEQLRAGHDVDAIGVNGEAVSIGEDMTGIWVASVASGSVADAAGIKPEDIILTMEGVSLGAAGTMTEYCDILRSHDPSDVLAIKVLRLGSEEVMEGQLNGRPLEVSFSLADQIEQSGDEPSGESTAGGATYAEYVTITDDSGILSVEAPADWSDVDSGPWVSNDQEIGLQIKAAPDLAAMSSGWDTPGLFFGVSSELAADTTLEKLLDGIDYSDSCTYDSREAFPEGTYTGFYDLWHTCGESESVAAVAALTPADSKDYVVLLEVYSVSEADLDALDHILSSFLVDAKALQDRNSAGATPVDTTENGDLLYEYTEVSQSALAGLLPTDYSDIESADWEVDGDVLGVTLTAARDIGDYNDTWTGPGVYVRTATGYEEDVNFDEWLDAYDLADNCEKGDRIKHSHTANGQTYTGAYDIWTNCADTNNAFFHLVAVSEPAGQLVLIDFQAADEADVEAFGILLDSFYVPAETGSGNTASNDELEFEYTEVTDETENLSVRVPTDWSDVNGGSWVLDEQTVGLSVSASPDLAAYNDSWTTPGLFYGATTLLGSDAEELLNRWDYSNSCKEVDRFDYDDALFVGLYDIYSECGDGNNLFAVLAAQFKTKEELLVLLQVAIPEDSSEEPFEQILASFTLSSEGVINALEETTNSAGTTATTTDETTSKEATVQVLAPTLNLRGGPGTNYNRLGALAKGDVLTVSGQVDNCGWFKVVTADGVEGWVSGGQQYVQLNGDCSAIPVAEAPAPPSNTSSGNTGNAGNTGNTGSTGGKGCITFRNNLGAELNITFTRPRDGWNTNFKVPGHGQRRECFDPARYTLTVDAPPPWSSFNDEVTLAAGDNVPYDVNPGE